MTAKPNHTQTILDTMKHTTQEMELLSDTEAKKQGIIQGFKALKRAAKMPAGALSTSVDQIAWIEILRVEKLEYDHLQSQMLRLEGIRDVKSMFQLERKRCEDKKLRKVKAEGIDTFEAKGERKTYTKANMADFTTKEATSD